MNEIEVGQVILTLGILLGSAHVVGHLFEKFHQPKLVGEIITGILVGPFVLGKLSPALFTIFFGLPNLESKTSTVLTFYYWFGLCMLMFISGSQVKRVFAKENQKEIGWILGVGTPLPFFMVLSLGLLSFLPLRHITGTANQEMSALLVLAIAVAVTSIPVISRIFYDLKILDTHFAGLILSSAVLEDLLLWAVLAIATALTRTATVAQEQIVGTITSHVLSTLGFTIFSLWIAPHLLRRLQKSRWNMIIRSSPLAYVVVVLFLFAAIATTFGVNLVFAAFLSGISIVGGLAGTEREYFADVLKTIEHFSTSVFIPIYFVMVGHRLVFGTSFSLSMLVVFLLGSSVLALISVGAAAKLAGFKGLDILNIAITNNARGGPGIVLASVAYESGIINASFYTTLVLTAVFTSQLAGTWLRFVLSKGWPLLSKYPRETWKVKSPSRKKLTSRA
jgi:Kef-type K+ transport system membrane component KefB